ncbi:hypothetical protein [Streptomyces fagopyri]|uniref:hypothetical protein n=1 Tax=Streptomyces fagopyri TaxID=2662397 RepID=UPI0033EAA466
MSAPDLRSQVKQAHRLVAEHLADCAAQRRQQQRHEAWNEQPDTFLETASLVLALALFQIRRDVASTPIRTAAQLLEPQASVEELFSALPVDLDPDL